MGRSQNSETWSVRRVEELIFDLTAFSNSFHSKQIRNMSIFLSRLLLPLETTHLHKSLFHITSVLSSKKMSFQDDSEVVLYADNSKQRDKKLTFAALKVLAKKEKEEKGKNLVLVTVFGTPNTMPAFRLVNNTALEVLLRKSRLNATNESFSILDLENTETVA